MVEFKGGGEEGRKEEEVVEGIKEVGKAWKRDYRCVNAGRDRRGDGGISGHGGWGEQVRRGRCVFEGVCVCM